MKIVRKALLVDMRDGSENSFTISYPRSSRAGWGAPQDLVAVCPNCGRSWAKTVQELNPCKSQRYAPRMIPCNLKASKLLKNFLSFYVVEKGKELLIEEFMERYDNWQSQIKLLTAEESGTIL